jgi:predicted metalloprotease with PDZ domain
MYEGQTEFWAWVLATRAGLYTRQQAHEVLAATAATFDHRAGRGWRDLQDTVYQGIVDFNDAPQAWESWQRGYDFYDEGVLVWLQVDMQLRELSKGKRSLDDFARAFLGGFAGKVEARQYHFDDVVQALDGVQPHDWASYLRARIDSHGPAAPLDGLARAGWKLVYDETPNLAIADAEGDGEYDDFRYSLGLQVAREEGKVNDVLWESPAYRAGLAKDMRLVAVSGMAYNAERLKRAIQSARKDTGRIELLVRQGEAYRTLQLDYRDGLRYPHLQRIAGVPDRLTQLLSPVR